MDSEFERRDTRDALDGGLGILGWLYDVRDYGALRFRDATIVDVRRASPICSWSI
jgi:hypothetical protein